MAAEPRRAPMMPLKDLVARYRAIAGELGEPVALAAFALSTAEIEQLFSSYNEDYHISRFFAFSDAGGEQFSINGIPSTHVAIGSEIETIL
jgi:hypothetical protein